MRKVLIVWFALSVIFAVLFAALGAFSRPAGGGAWVALASLVLGAIAAPQVGPHLFRRPMIWQLGFGIVGFQLLAFGFGVRIEGHLLAILPGVVFGYAGPFVVRYL